MTADAFTRQMRARDKTLRDWYAGQALVGLLAGRNPGMGYTPEEAAGRAFHLADAMLAQRSKGL